MKAGKLAGINLIIFVLLLLNTEGLSSIILKIYRFEKNYAEKNYIDPYTKKPTDVGRLKYVCINERFAPNSIAYFYYKNDNLTSPKGLYTDQYGFIHNGDPNRDLKKDLKNGQRIFLFGGSSVAGAISTSSNHANIAAYMERYLNLWENKENQVVNAGFSGYQSFREFIFAAHLIGEFDIDTLVFLNGRNDWYQLVTTNQFYRNYMPEIPLTTQDFLDCGPLNDKSNIFRSLETYLLIGKIKRKLFSKESPAVTPVLNIVGDGVLALNDAFIIDPDSLFKSGFSRKYLSHRPEAVKNYIDNLRSIAGLCIAHKKRCIIALQPTLGYGNRVLTPAESQYLHKIPFDNWVETQKIFYDEVRAEFKNLCKEYEGENVDFIDLSSLFDTVPERVFLDSIHYLDHGNCKLGAALAAQLKFRDWTQYSKFSIDCNW